MGRVPFHAVVMDSTFLYGSVCIDGDVAASPSTADVTSGILIVRGAAAERGCLSFLLSLRSCFQFLGLPSEMTILSLMSHEI